LYSPEYKINVLLTLTFSGMNNYQKICLNCGNVYYNMRPQSTTCSQKCRTQLHYKRKYGNLTVETFLHSPAKTFHQRTTKKTGESELQEYQRFELSENLPGAYTDNTLYDIGKYPSRIIEAFPEEGYHNYFVDSIYQMPIIHAVMYNGQIYHFIGFFEDRDNLFEEFYETMALENSYFLFLETDMEFYDEIIDAIHIYVNQWHFERVFNDPYLPEKYGFTVCDPQENPFIFLQKETSKYLINKINLGF
jgi:hypothetical protein